MRPYLGPPWTDSHQIWAVDVFHHAPPIHGIQNAEMQKKKKKNFCDVITFVLCKPLLIGGEEICDSVPAKFKHVMNNETFMLLCCDWIMYVPALWIFQKADFQPFHVSKKYTTFSSPRQELSLSIFAWGIPVHTNVFSLTHNAVVLRV